MELLALGGPNHSRLPSVPSVRTNTTARSKGEEPLGKEGVSTLAPGKGFGEAAASPTAGLRSAVGTGGRDRRDPQRRLASGSL